MLHRVHAYWCAAAAPITVFCWPDCAHCWRLAASIPLRPRHPSTMGRGDGFRMAGAADTIWAARQFAGGDRAPKPGSTGRDIFRTLFAGQPDSERLIEATAAVATAGEHQLASKGTTLALRAHDARYSRSSIGR